MRGCALELGTLQAAVTTIALTPHRAVRRNAPPSLSPLAPPLWDVLLAEGTYSLLLDVGPPVHTYSLLLDVEPPVHKGAKCSGHRPHWWGAHQGAQTTHLGRGLGQLAGCRGLAPATTQHAKQVVGTSNFIH